MTLSGSGRRQVRELVGGASYCAGHDPRLLFGLGKVETVEEVEVRWPSGIVTQLKNLSGRRYYQVEEAESEKSRPAKPSRLEEQA